MMNPWLEIPYEDYENHMEKVGQSLILSNLFNQSLNKYEPGSIIVLGASIGNGFQYIDSQITSEVHAIDINPEYLSILESKYSSGIGGLVTHRCNIEDGLPDIPPSDLIFVALVFEYVDFARVF